MIYELFSQRKKRVARSGIEDVYQYDLAPQKLRVQLQQLLVEALGPDYISSGYEMGRFPRHNASAWEFIERTLARENSLHRIYKGDSNSEKVLGYLGSAETDGFLDVVELCARYIDRVVGKMLPQRRQDLGINQDPEEAKEEINFRFREAAFGFQYEGGELIGLDSDFMHQEVIVPAIRLLADSRFSGAEAEFMNAHRHYRAGEGSQAITEAAKAFESALKVALDEKKWAYEAGARASDLVRVAKRFGLWPSYLDASFDQLLATLTSGLPKVRNEEGAHGQGSQVRTVPNYIVAYALHLAGANIRLISEAVNHQRQE